MLVEIAIGDAYGAGFEYAKPTPDRPNDLSRYYQHPRHGIIPGCYTDDTQMSLAVAEALIENGAAATSLQFVEKFILAFQRDPAKDTPAAFGSFCSPSRTLRTSQLASNRIQRNPAPPYVPVPLVFCLT